jgi:hypothetical protein
MSGIKDRLLKIRRGMNFSDDRLVIDDLIADLRNDAGRSPSANMRLVYDAAEHLRLRGWLSVASDIQRAGHLEVSADAVFNHEPKGSS